MFLVLGERKKTSELLGLSLLTLLYLQIISLTLDHSNVTFFIKRLVSVTRLEIYHSTSMQFWWIFYCVWIMYFVLFLAAVVFGKLTEGIEESEIIRSFREQQRIFNDNNMHAFHLNKYEDHQSMTQTNSNSFSLYWRELSIRLINFFLVLFP